MNGKIFHRKNLLRMKTKNAKMTTITMRLAITIEKYYENKSTKYVSKSENKKIRDRKFGEYFSLTFCVSSEMHPPQLRIFKEKSEMRRGFPIGHWKINKLSNKFFISSFVISSAERLINHSTVWNAFGPKMMRTVECDEKKMKLAEWKKTKATPLTFSDA